MLVWHISTQSPDFRRVRQHCQLCRRLLTCAGHVFTWMTSVSAEFVNLIQNCSPPALILVAHFASVSLAVRSAWYTRDWGNYCLTGVGLALEGTDFQQWLEWPKAHAHSNMVSRDEHIVWRTLHSQGSDVQPGHINARKDGGRLAAVLSAMPPCTPVLKCDQSASRKLLSEMVPVHFHLHPKQ